MSSYKGPNDHRAARADILSAIEQLAPLSIPESLRSVIVDDKQRDALDSIIAAFAAFRPLPQLLDQRSARTASYGLEGYVYR